MSRKVKKSREESLEILREYLTSDASKSDIERKYSLHRDWVRRNLIKFAVADKKGGLPMKKLPGNVSIEKTYRDSDRAYEAMAHAAVNKVIRHTPRYDHEEMF